MSEELKHIFDKSACLSKRQMKEYINGSMNREEAHAVEHHLTYCEFCSEAVDGLMADTRAGLTALEELNTRFIHDFYQKREANAIKLAKEAAKAEAKTTPTKKIWLSITGIAAAVLIGFGTMRYFDEQRTGSAPIVANNKTDNTTPREMAAPIAQSDVIPEKEQPKTEDKKTSPPIADDIPPQPAPLAAAPSMNKAITQESAALKKDNEEAKQIATRVQKEAPSSINDGQRKTETLAAGGAKASEQAFAADAASEENTNDNEAAMLNEAERLYEKGKYSKALAIYKKQIKGSDSKNGRQAMLMAAKCYLGMNDEANAKKLLQQLVDEGSGSERRQAKRLLRELE